MTMAADWRRSSSRRTLVGQPTNTPVRGPALSDTRDRIVDAARELFYEQGYESASLKQVAAAAGVHTGSIYHFFPTKAELVGAVLEHYLQLLDPVIMAPAREAAADPVERVMALLAGYRSHLLSTLFTRGCPIGALALELADSHPRARELVRANFDAWRAAVADMLEEALPRAMAEEAAAFALSVMEGSVMQARTYRSMEPFDASVRQLRRQLESLVEEGVSA